MSEFQRFVEKQSKQIEQDLKKAEKESYIVQCPACYQQAFVLEDRPSCSFCGYSTEAELAANEWIETILGISHSSALKDGVHYPLWDCPACERETLVDIGPSGSQSERDQYICFACGQIWKESDKRECAFCGRPYFADEDDDWGMCDYCLAHRLGD